MTISNKINITKRSDKSSPLTHDELDRNFDELGNVIDDASANENALQTHENAADPHPQYATDIRVDDIEQGNTNLSSASVTSTTGTQTISAALDDRVEKGEVGAESVTSATGTQTVVDALDQRGPVFDNVTNMKAATGLKVGVKCRTLGYYTPGDGGGNDYEVVAAGTGTDDGGNFIDLAGSGLQAKGLFENGVFLEQFGADSSGVTDSSAAWQAAFGYKVGPYIAERIEVGYRSGSKIRIDNDVWIPRVSSLVSPQQRIATSSKNYPDLDNGIALSSTATINLHVGAQLKGHNIYRQGLKSPPTDGEASFAGTAVTITEGDVFIENNSIMGFEYGIYNDGVKNRPRLHIFENQIDCINGIVLGAAYDISRIENNHIFPLTSPILGDQHLRSGAGIRLYAVNDWTKLVGNYVYGYEIGYDLEDTNSITMLNCAYDAPLLSEVTGPRTSVGLKVSGTSNEVEIIGCQIAAADKAYVQNNGQNRKVTIIGSHFWANQNSNIEVQSGNLDIVATRIRKQDTSGIGSMNPDGIIVNNINSIVRHSMLDFFQISNEIVETAGNVRASLEEGFFTERKGANHHAFIKGDSGGNARLNFGNDDDTAASNLTWFTSNGLACSILGDEKWRATPTGVGVGTGLPRASLHSVGATVLGLSGSGIPDTVLDDNVGAQAHLYLDEANNKLKFRVIYSGAAGDASRLVKEGEINLL